MNDHELSRDGAYFHSAAHEEADVVTHGVCQGCGLCAMVCPTHAMTMGGLHPMVHLFQKNPTFQLSLCVHCGRCRAVCPMGVDMTDPSRRRENATECILCYACTEACPTKALR